MLRTFTNLGIIIILTVTCAKAKIWKFPRATDLQTSLDVCQITDLSFLDLHRNFKSYSRAGQGDIRCLTKELGLWNDDEGFKAKRLVQLLNKHRETIEISVVIDYCNNSSKQSDVDKWATEAFNCFARGDMGPWIREHFKSVFKKKLANK